MGISDPSHHPITSLLQRWKEGDRSAERQLFELLYSELKESARRVMRAERPDHTLEPTALVHEAYVRLVPAGVDWRDRRHFLAVASRVMRRVLVDHARARRRDKRGGDRVLVTLEDNLTAAGSADADLLLLEEALGRLEAIDPRKAQFVEMRYFAGLSNREIAAGAGVSERTVKRELQFGRAWLRREVAERSG